MTNQHFDAQHHDPFWTGTTNRTIIAVGLLLCVVLGVGGAYLLGLLELVGALH